MKRRQFPNALFDPQRLSWLLVLLALSGCGAPTPSSSGVPAILPPTVTVTTLAPPTAVSPTSASAMITIAPAPDAESPTAPIPSLTPIAAPTMPPTPSAAISTPQVALPRLVFNGNLHGQFGFYIVNADGTHLIRLTTSPQDRLPAWSPDGNQIVFSSDGDDIGNPDIFVINTDGTGLVRLTTDRDFTVDDTPFWSHDGRFIAFTSDRGSKTPYGDIYVMHADGTQVQRVTTDPTFENIVGWSPDSSRIFYTINHDGAWTTHRVNRDGTQDTVIVTGAAEGLSPDGTALAFVRADAGQYDVWVCTADGTNIRRLTNTPTVEYSLTWSPDGKRIAFNPGMVVINVDGSGQTQLSDPQTSNGEMHWSPDGKYIAFQASNANYETELAIMDVKTGTSRLLTPGMGGQAGFAWSPK